MPVCLLICSCYYLLTHLSTHPSLCSLTFHPHIVPSNILSIKVMGIKMIDLVGVTVSFHFTLKDIVNFQKVMLISYTNYTGSVFK
jgi:hypothetical protein